MYDARDFVEKNMDRVPNVTQEALSASEMQLLKTLWSDSGEKQDSQQLQRRPSRIGGASLSKQFSNQLAQLLQTVEVSQPTYIKCINPNLTGSADPADFNSHYVCDQLRSTGMLEAIKIRKIGFSYRETFDSFNEKYAMLATQQDRVACTQDPPQLSRLIMQRAWQLLPNADFLLEEHGRWQIGKSKIFLKDEAKTALDGVLFKKQLRVIILI